MNLRQRVKSTGRRRFPFLAAMVGSLFLQACAGNQTDQAVLAEEKQEIERLRQENQELPKLRSENDEVQRLRKENQEIFKLRAQYQDLLRLRKENEQLKSQLTKAQQAGQASK